MERPLTFIIKTLLIYLLFYFFSLINCLVSKNNFLKKNCQFFTCKMYKKWMYCIWSKLSSRITINPKIDFICQSHGYITFPRIYVTFIITAFLKCGVEFFIRYIKQYNPIIL